MTTGVTERAGSVLVPHHARGASMARHHVADDLCGSLAPDLVADTASVVSELVGNAVRHARPLSGGLVRVEWEVTSDAVEVRVSDGGSAEQPRLRRVPPDALDGRGLTIVAALADRWGVVEDGGGRSVWAQLDR